MSPEQQRIKIAEACGWTMFGSGPLNSRIHPLFAPWGITARKPEHKDKSEDDFAPYDPIPDYLNDLNAINDAEKILTHQQEYSYHDYLTRLVMKTDRHPCYEACRANATLRAEAFLRTLNLWTE